MAENIIDLRDIIENKESEPEQYEAWKKAFDEQMGGVDFEEYADNEPTAIHDSYFEEYAEELAMEIGYIDREKRYQWPFNCIDWEDASEELKNDYSEITVDDETYYIRSY